MMAKKYNDECPNCGTATVRYKRGTIRCLNCGHWIKAPVQKVRVKKVVEDGRT